MRGTPDFVVSGATWGGIIPAHAGNTTSRPVFVPWRRDHPRACGEHMSLLGGPWGIAGSSPRMRGTRSVVTFVKWIGGIIPAHAGNTQPVRWSSSTLRDHPRACGEHAGDVSNQQTGAGSSPRGRAIPAHMGSSPRMRGTHFEISTIPRFLDSFCLFFIQFHFEYFFACRYLLALLHPRRRAPPKDTSFALDGRLTSSNPSQSVGDQSAPCTLNARCCSFLAE